MIIKNITDVFWLGGDSAKLTDYTLYENDTGVFIFKVRTSPFNTGISNTTTMTVIMDHRWGAAQGYIYNSTGVYTPDGSQRLIIATTD